MGLGLAATPWRLFGARSWVFLGCSWRSWGALGRSWVLLGALGAFGLLCFGARWLLCFLLDLFSMLNVFSDCAFRSLARSGLTVQGARGFNGRGFWRALGGFLGALGALLGGSWAFLGVLGVFLGALGCLRLDFGTILRRF